MNVPVVPRYITLVVSNPEALQYGSTPRHRFDREGGTIGCRGANWILLDRLDRIKPIHCEICQEGGHFCVVDRSGETHINGSHAPLGHRVGARVGEGDTLQIGPYRLTVHMHETDSITGDEMTHDVAELFQGDELAVAHADEGMAALANPWERSAGDTAAFQSLAVGPDRREELDPLVALDLADRENASPACDPLDTTHYGLVTATSQRDLGATRFEAVSGAPNTIPGERQMTNPSTEVAQAQRWLAGQQSAGGDPRQLLAPLLEGLQTSPGGLDSQAAYRLLLESGAALHAAIVGLTALYNASPRGDDRLALLNRTLQPIEDNPLRLGLSYQDTVQALFGSGRSVVHLSPKAAVEESLEQVRRHHGAVVQAIGASLEALLRSFAPDTLMQRFQRYRPHHSEEADDWAWQMYTHYFNELASSRQQGFEKLFWEIFEQTYDRALRAEAQ
ncbi:type VI secretion system-associated FHA domain protein TagH [Dyella kyungheensis]|uniref:Type VI secretion system-associated FHA domain protein TagH n=1 Tax=Dyella kyungheensis TaxID=1242174 RepID=A0ABS2JXI1_9GAMM|nr:type VI secretion system-associated FHA domain protein TagH [Dyella kyungheensis]MBM7123319.1 type VI secretion system-associated FHA domain protein TagH [Dyella kyungheensis]